METNPKCNFSVSLWREIIFWILTFWQQATVKMACQSNDFLSSGSSSKAGFYFHLFSFFTPLQKNLSSLTFFVFWFLCFSIPSEFLTFFSSTKLSFFSCDRMVQLSVLEASSALMFLCSSVRADDGVSKSRTSLLLCSFEAIGGCFLVEAAEFEWTWQAQLPS